MSVIRKNCNSAAKEVKLKPCPFCGGPAKLAEHYWENTRTESFTVDCVECGGCMDQHMDSEQEAADAWNQRAVESDPMESGVQRWTPFLKCFGNGTYQAQMTGAKSGDYILHADLLKIFAWIVEHWVACHNTWFSWRTNGGWDSQDVPDDGFLAAIVELMGGDG